jgi:NAD(P)-dependent dehydrogenase (short-subunit alcohol dehydrogenase family)
MRTVVITGAGRGLGLASAVRLHRSGWHVVAAMRSVDAGLERITSALGTDADPPRLTGISLDLCDEQSITQAAKAVVEAVGAPDALVHNAGFSVAGCTEDVPLSAWDVVLRTNLLGPVQLTN